MGAAMQIESRHEKIVSNARKAASRLKRRVWWADKNDLINEAVMEQLKAEPLFDATRGTHGTIEFGAYAWTIAERAAKRACLYASSPVSHKHRPHRMIGMKRETTHYARQRDPVGNTSELQERDELVAENEWSAEASEKAIDLGRVWGRLEALLGTDGAYFALSVLSHEYRPQDVSREHGVPVAEVYAYVRHIKSVLMADETLRSIWRNL